MPCSLDLPNRLSDLCNWHVRCYIYGDRALWMGSTYVGCSINMDPRELQTQPLLPASVFPGFVD